MKNLIKSYRRVLSALSISIFMTYFAMIPILGAPIYLLGAPIFRILPFLNTYKDPRAFSLYFKVEWPYFLFLMYYFILVYGFLIIRSKLRTWIKSQNSNNILFLDINSSILKNKKPTSNDKQTLNSENNNSYQNITPNTTTSPDTYTNTQSNTPTPEVQNTYQQASMNNNPKVTFDAQTVNNENTIVNSSEAMQEIQAEYKSNQKQEKNLAQKIQDHYQPEVNFQNTKIVSEPNPNKFRNLFFSVFLILGFLAFAFLSLGGIVAGDLTISGVLAVGSIILVIDGYLFYLMWFKK